MAKSIYDEYGVSEERFREYCKCLPEDVSAEEFENNLLLIKTRYSLFPFQVAKIIEQRFDLVSSKGMIDKLFEVQNRFSIQPERIKYSLTTNKLKYVMPDIEYLTEVQSVAGLNDDEIANLFLYTKNPYVKFDANLIKRDLQLLESAGLERQNLLRGIGVLTCKPKRLIDILMIAEVQGIEVNEFVQKNCYRIHSELAFARLMLEREGKAPKGMVYSNDEDYFNATGYTYNRLRNEFFMSPTDKLRLEREFIENYPYNSLLLDIVAEDFIDYANQEGRAEGLPNPQNAKANWQLLEETKQLNNQQLIELMYDKDTNFYGIELLSPSEIACTDTKLLKHNMKVLGHLVGKKDLAKFILANPCLVSDNTNLIRNKFAYLHNKYGMSVSEFGLVIVKDPSFLEVENLEILESALASKYQLSKNDFKNLMVGSPRTCTSVDVKAVEDKFEMLKAFGVAVTGLQSEEYRILGSRLGEVEMRLKLALLNRLDLKELMKSPSIISPKVIFARMMASQKGEYPKGKIYATAVEEREMAQNQECLPHLKLLQKYKYDGRVESKINELFSKYFSDIQRKVDEVYGRAVEFAKPCESEIEDTIQLNFKRRLKRICGLPDEELDRLVAGVGKMSKETFAKVALNFYALKSMGFDPMTIVRMPKILRSTPEDIKVKAMLSRLAGKSDEQFLKRNYTYGAESVYAKMSYAEEQRKTPLYLYDNNADYINSINKSPDEELNIDDIKRLYPLTTVARERLKELYKEKFSSVEAGEDE